MNNQPLYESAAKTLSENDFRVTRNMLNEKIVSLSVYCSPILVDDKIKEVKRLLGARWRIWGDTNHQKVNIELKTDFETLRD